MTTVDLSRLQRMPQKKRYTVCGFVRNEMAASSEYEIPSTIFDLCLLFYIFENDKWDLNNIGSKMEISDDKTIITTTESGGFSTTFLERIMEYGIHEWKFKIIECQRWAGYVVIGIWRLNKENDIPPTDTFFTDKNRFTNKFYSFDITQGSINQWNHQFGRPVKYGWKCKKDSIIEMILDFQSLSLKFKIDGIDCGQSHSIESGQYKAAVSMFNPYDSIQLLSS